MDIWSSSFQLMYLGMGTVFVFLVLLVLATTAMSALLNRFANENIPLSNSSNDVDIEVAAVAAVAYMRHKK
jgi:oxaloacetate decarboxylase (Na+ extruding) subunit gamma